MKEKKTQGEGLKVQEKEFSEQDSILVIKEMIQVSRKRIENNGILFIIWGWTWFIVETKGFLLDLIGETDRLYWIFDNVGALLLTLAILFTVYYVFFKKKRIKSYISNSLKFVWFSVAASVVLINLILFNQGVGNDGGILVPIIMLSIATAVVVTGGILRYKLLIFGGIVFGIGGYLYSFPDLGFEGLIGPISYLLAFIIPGHVMYYKRKRRGNV
ncbi:hypothetical protein ACFLSI_00245 [Bacteroidota bacterium]